MANATIASVGALIAAAAAAAGTAATEAAANATTIAANATTIAGTTAAAAVTVATAAGDGVLHIVTAHRPPLVNIRNNGTSFSGMLIDMLPRLLDNAGIKNPYKLYQLTTGGGGSLRPNGTWSGVMGELTTGPADMALFPLTLTSLRSQYISATVPFLDSGYALLVKAVKQDHAYSFVVPFKTSTWMLILASLVAVILFVSLLDTWTRKARYRALERLHGLDTAKVRRKKERAMQHATESIFMLIGQGSSPSSHSWSVKVLFICWAVFSVILLSAYTANLTANLTVSRLGSTIKTLAELKRSGSFFGVPADSSVLRYFQDSSDGLAASLLPMVIEYKTPAQGVAAVRAGKIAAFATDFPVLKGFAQEPPCDLAVSDETWGPGQLVIGLQPNSTLQTSLDRALLKLAEEGILSDLRRKWFTEMSACAAIEAADHSDAESLTPSNVAPVFYLLIGGVVFAVLWAAAEVLFYRFAYDKVTQIRRNASVRGTLERLRSMRPPSRASNGSMRGGSTPDLPVSSRDTDRNLHKRGGGGGDNAGKPKAVQLLRSDTLSENLTQSTVSSDADISDDLSSDHWRHRVAEGHGGNATDTTDASIDADTAGGFVDLPDAPMRSGRDAGGVSAFEAAAARAVAAAGRRERRREQRERAAAAAAESSAQQQGEGRQRVVSFAEPPPPAPAAGGGAGGGNIEGEGGNGAGEIVAGDAGAPSDGWRPVNGRWQPAGDGWRAPQQFRGSQPPRSL